MTEPGANDTPVPTGEKAVRDRRHSPRAMVPPPEHRTSAVFPDHADRDGRAPERVPARIHGELWEALTQPRNLVPLTLIVILAFVGIDVLASLLTRSAPPPPAEFLAHLVVSSSQPKTSLFGNDRYLGEIGPKAREFAVAPGQMRLRLVRSYCLATDTTLSLKVGEQLTVGPLDPNCGRS